MMLIKNPNKTLLETASKNTSVAWVKSAAPAVAAVQERGRGSSLQFPIMNNIALLSYRRCWFWACSVIAIAGTI